MTRIALGIGLIVGLAGCEWPRSCTLVGCLDGVSMDLRGPGLLALGDYEVVLTAANGLTAVCTTTIAEDTSQVGTTVDCDDDRVNMGVLSGADGPLALLIETPNLGGDVTIEVILDDASLIDETVELTYERVQPNGPGCGPTCRFAMVDLDLP